MISLIILIFSCLVLHMYVMSLSFKSYYLQFIVCLHQHCFTSYAHLWVDEYWFAILAFSSCCQHVSVFLLNLFALSATALLLAILICRSVLHLWTSLHTFRFRSQFALFICSDSAFTPHHHSTAQSIMSKAGSWFDVCGDCHKSYKRLSSHVSQNALYANHYTNRVDKTSSVCHRPEQ